MRNAATLIGVLATRVGAVPHGNVLPGAIRRQRWSALNVPLIGGAASHVESCPVFEWLNSATSAVNEPVHVYGGETTASGAVRIGGSPGSYSFLGREVRSRIVGLVREELVSSNTTWSSHRCWGTRTRSHGRVQGRRKSGPAGIRLSDVDVE